jgi:hypothetical protein
VTRALVITVLLAVTAVPVFAQGTDPALRKHRFTLSGGLSWLAGHDIGSSTATLRRNEARTLTPGTSTLFRADATMLQASGVEGRVGYALTRQLSVEFGGAYGMPHVAVDITEDVEAGPQRLSDQRVSQYVVDASVVWQMPRLKLGRRARPYITVGAGYLRQLDADRAQAQTGKIVHAGGGIRYWLRGGDTVRRALGLRLETRMQVRSGGIDFEGGTRAFPVVNVFGFFGF